MTEENQIDPPKDKVGDKWRQGRVLGFYWEATTSNIYYEAWIPATWNSLCITVRRGDCHQPVSTCFNPCFFMGLVNSFFT